MVHSTIFVFKIPPNQQDALGTSENDFSFVKIEAYDAEGELLPDAPSVEIWGLGPLGTLKGGLCNLEDRRDTLNKDAIVAMAKETLDGHLSKKRPEAN